MFNRRFHKFLLLPMFFVGTFLQLAAQCQHENRPQVGVGVIVIQDGKILLGLRKDCLGAGTWAPPGGHLKFGESFEECAFREVYEETGLELLKVKAYIVTNNVFEDEEKHYVVIFMVSDQFIGDVQLLEPEKCDCWAWFDVNALPEDLFLPLKNLLIMQANGDQYE